VLQDALVGIMEQGQLLGASCISLALSAPVMQHVYENMGYFALRIVLRPSDVSGLFAQIPG